MPKEKTVVPIDPTLRAPALALRVFEKEIEKLLNGVGTPLARQDAVQLSGIQSYTILLFLEDFTSSRWTHPVTSRFFQT